MKLWVLLILLSIPYILVLKAWAVEVILNPYEGIDYDEPNAYVFYEEQGCHCHEEQNADFD